MQNDKEGKSNRNVQKMTDRQTRNCEKLAKLMKEETMPSINACTHKKIKTVYEHNTNSF